MGARAYLYMERLGSLTPCLEDVLRLNYRNAWKKSIDQVGTLFNKRFGSDWRKPQEDFWTEFEKKLTVDEAGIIKSRSSEREARQSIVLVQRELDRRLFLLDSLG
jgi:hypothetical protein